MSEANPHLPAEKKPSDPTPPAPKKKRSKIVLLLKLVVALIVLVVLLVVLAPTIISLAPVRSFVVKQVDGAIPGRVEIASWSFGWFSPVRIEGVKVFDPQNRQILTADEVSTEATLLGLARQNFDLGKTVVRADATHIEIRADGTTNLHDAFGLKPSTEPPSEEPVSIPDVKTDLTLDLRGSATLLDKDGKPVRTVQLRQGSGGTVKIADINKGVDTDLKFVYDVMEGNAAGTPSTITVVGSADAVEKNELDLANLSAKLKLALANVQTKAAEPVLTMLGVKDITADAAIDGVFDVDLQPGQTGGAQGEFSIAVAALRVPQLPDTYSTKEPIKLPIIVSRVTENGVSRIKIDIRATTPEMKASIIGDLPEAALQRLSENQMPGADGSLSFTFSADPKRAAEAFPNTLKLLPGVTVSGGSLYAKIDLWLSPGKIVYGVDTNISASGTHEGKTIQIEPITLATAGTVTSLADPVMGLRDLSLKLASAFANFTGGGASVHDLVIGGDADLAKLHSQASQFSDLSQYDLSGKAVVGIRNKAASEAPADANTPVEYALDLGATLTDVRVKVPQLAQPLDVRYLKTGVSGAYTLAPQAEKPLTHVRTLSATLALGESDADLLLDSQIELTDVDPNALSVKHFEVKKGTINNLAKLQQRIDPFVPALKAQGIELVGGAVYFVAAGSASVPLAKEGQTPGPMQVTLQSLSASTPGLHVRKGGKDIIDRDRFTVDAAGTMGQAGKTITIDLSQLKITSESGLIGIEKTDAPLTVVLGDAPIPHGKGQLKVNANLVPVNRIVQALAKDPVQQVTSGSFAGTLTLASSDKDSSVALDGKLESLTLPGVIENQSVSVAVGGIVEGDPTQAKSASLRANIRGEGLFSVVTQEDAIVNFAAGTPLTRMVEKAKLQIGVNDAKKAYQIAAALMPGMNPPMTPNSGGIAIVATVVPGRADLDIKASRLELNQKGKTFVFDKKKPVSILAGVQMKGDEALTQLIVDKLEVDADIVKANLVEQIVVDDPMGAPKPRGVIEVSGTLDRATQLLAFLNPEGAPLPYRGAFKLRNKLAIAGDDITATVDGTITDLTILDAKNQPAVTEKEVTINADLLANLQTEVAKINKLELETVTSKAAKITVTGGARDFFKNAIVLNDITVRIDAVGEQAWPIMFPLLTPELQAKLATAKVTGPIVVNLLARGTYVKAGPKDETLTLGQQIGSLFVKGDLALASADLMQASGLSVSDFKQLFTLEKGRLITGHKDATSGKWTFAPPSKVNGGELNLGSIVIDLTSPDMLVKVGRNQKIMVGVQLNPVMAASLGSIASLVFKDAKEAAGLVDVTVVECENVPLADLMGGKQGKATILYSVRDLRIDGPLPGLLAKSLSWGDSGIVGSIDDGKLTLAEGIAHQDMAVKILKSVEQENARTGRRERVNVTESLSFNGAVDLPRGRFKGYGITLSPGLLPRDWRNNYANGMKVGIDGRVDDYMGVVSQAIGKVAAQGFITEGLEDLLKKKK